MGTWAIKLLGRSNFCFVPFVSIYVFDSSTLHMHEYQISSFSFENIVECWSVYFFWEHFKIFCFCESLVSTIGIKAYLILRDWVRTLSVERKHKPKTKLENIQPVLRIPSFVNGFQQCSTNSTSCILMNELGNPGYEYETSVESL